MSESTEEIRRRLERELNDWHQRLMIGLPVDVTGVARVIEIGEELVTLAEILESDLEQLYSRVQAGVAGGPYPPGSVGALVAASLTKEESASTVEVSAHVVALGHGASAAPNGVGGREARAPRARAPRGERDG